jgi:energy-coupling factor transporter ATP-binding protein EcfA2
MRSDEAQFESSLMVFAALTAVALVVWGWFDFHNGGGILLNHVGVGVISILVGLLWLVIAAAGGRAGEVAHFSSAGFIAIGIGIALSQPDSYRGLSLIAVAVALGAYLLWHAFIVAIRRTEGRERPSHDVAYQSLLVVWLVAFAATLDIHMAIRLGAIMVLIAWVVVPLSADWGAMFTRLWGGMLVQHTQNASASSIDTSAYENDQASPSDEDLLEAVQNDEHKARMMAIREYIKSQFENRWQPIRFDQMVYEAPSYVTYVLRKPDDISYPEILKHEMNIASKLRIDDELMHLSAATKLGAILIQITRENKKVLWYDDPRMIAAREEMDSPQDQFRVVLGLDSFSNPVSLDIASRDTPHVLLCGKAGSGKSSTLHTILSQLLERNSPEDARLMFIDGKRVTAAFYAKMRHLWQPVVTNLDNAPQALETVANEVDRRMEEFEKMDPVVTNIQTWNRRFPAERLPCLFLVIDEATMLASPKEAPSSLVEAYSKYVGHVAARGRAAGVYLILATQRPSVENLGANVVGQISQRVVHKLSKLSESTMALNATSNDNSALKLSKSGDALLTDGGTTTRFSSAYLPEDAERGHINVPAKIKQIIEKWGANDF